MRFAYIDSQGKEVGIPSVEALQLRIELGAITGKTLFYDASKDRWDPAGDHEIFRTLSREIRERGQGGPRPPTPKAEARAPENEEAGNSKARAADPFDKEQDPLADTTEPGEVGWIEADLEDLAQPEAQVGGEEGESKGGDDWDVDLGEFGALDLAPGLEGSDEAEGAPPLPEPIGVHTPSAGDPSARETTTEAGDGLEDPGAGLELEGAWADRPIEAAASVDDSDLELEKPLSEQGSPPVETEGEREPAGPAVDLDFSAPLEVDDGTESDVPPLADAVGSGAAATGDDEEERPDGVLSPRMPGGMSGRRDPYQRRVQPPRAQERVRRPRASSRRRGRGPGALVLGLVGAVAVAGGWFGWSALRGEDNSAVELEESVVAIPELPPELEPVMRAVADSAHSDMLDTLRAMAAEFDLAVEPNPDWLAGVYLANAGSYRDVLLYWAALRSYIERVRGADEETFLQILRVRLAASDLPQESRDTVFARVRAGFRATAPARRDVYGDVEDLIDSATGLHEFLVANQANIDYEPAVGLSRDPVTEAIPSHPALGDEMWDRVGRIPTALDALGTLDRVTTERILDVLMRRIETLGVR